MSSHNFYSADTLHIHSTSIPLPSFLDTPTFYSFFSFVIPIIFHCLNQISTFPLKSFCWHSLPPLTHFSYFSFTVFSMYLPIYSISWHSNPLSIPFPRWTLLKVLYFPGTISTPHFHIPPPLFFTLRLSHFKFLFSGYIYLWLKNLLAVLTFLLQLLLFFHFHPLQATSTAV